MSNLLPVDSPLECRAFVSNEPELQVYPAKEATIGTSELTVYRALPRAKRRMVGPWCFLDHFGPLTFHSGKPMSVGPHPHIGLQTVTWLVDGEGLHKDSLGSEQLIRPGQLNLMIAGSGIAHSEETPRVNSAKLHGLQLWTALPDSHRNVSPSFNHYDNLPEAVFSGCAVKVLTGRVGEAGSPALVFSPIVAAELSAKEDCRPELPLHSGFEHALFLIYGSAILGGEALQANTLYYLGTTRTSVELSLSKGTKLMLIGGEPFPEKILMWWNFVARTQEEIEQARFHWEHEDYFGSIKDSGLNRIPAPPLSLRFRKT